MEIAIDIKTVTSDKVIHLRHQLLRKNQSLENCRYLYDDTALTCHFSAYANNQQVGIVSVYQKALASISGNVNLSVMKGKTAWQIRGMAVLPEYRKLGIGRKLIAAIKQQLNVHTSNNMFWCNARVAALGFYQRLGFSCFGDAFVIDPIGPHFVMICSS